MSDSQPVLMVLGGAEKTLPLVQSARSRGVHVLLCDQNENSPCRQAASEFARISTTDLPALRDILEKRQINGIVSFGSDLMAMVAARLADEFGLPGNPPTAVETLVRKDHFRGFLSDQGFNAPRSVSARALPEATMLAGEVSLPVIVKPADGAGSTAVSRIEDWVSLPNCFAAALEASRDGWVVIEEFLERDHPHMIGGDIFVDRGEIVFWGLMNSHRAIPDRPFLPTGTSYPLSVSEQRLAEVKHLLRDLVARLGLRFGGMNVEVMYCTDGKPYIIELAPRNGGNRIPELLEMATGFNLFGALVEAALGRPVPKPLKSDGHKVMSNFMLHSGRAGHFQSLSIADELRPYVRQTCLDVSSGDAIRAFDRAPDALGTIFLEFDDNDAQQRMLARLPDLITVQLEQAA